jgi:hypothetical protein
MYPNWQSVITGTGRDSFVPFPVLGVPFPVLGYAISGTVIHWAPYWNWTLCAWSHFWYRAMPVPVWSFVGSRTRTGIYVCVVPFPVPGYAISGTVVFRVPYGTGIYVGGPISGTGLCQFRYGHF